MRKDGTAHSPLNGRLVFQVRGVDTGNNRLYPTILSHIGRALTSDQEMQDGKYWGYPFRKGLEIYNQDKFRDRQMNFIENVELG